MFRALGIVVALYTLYAAITDAVYAKSGPGGWTVLRRESPEYFWIVIAIYLGLGIAMMTVF